MSREHMSGVSDYDAVSNWTGGTPSEASSVDTIKDLMQRFTLDCQPDLTLKLRSRVSGLILGADITHNPVTNTQKKALVVKPVSLHAPWRRFRVDDAGTVQLRSKKLQWWLLTLDMEAHINPRTRTSSLNWRNVTARGNDIEQEVSADIGYAHGDIPRLDLVIWPTMLLGRKRGSAPLIAEEAVVSPTPAPVVSRSSRAPRLPQLKELERWPAAAKEAAAPLRSRASELLAAAQHGAQQAATGVLAAVHAGARHVAMATAPRPEPEAK